MAPMARPMITTTGSRNRNTAPRLRRRERRGARGNRGSTAISGAGTGVGVRETAAVATYARLAVKDKDSGRPLEPIAEKMNEMAKKYYDTSRPAYCAQHGFVDEIVPLAGLRGYLKAFAGCVYQNPQSICPKHLMLLPRLVRGRKRDPSINFRKRSRLR